MSFMLTIKLDDDASRFSSEPKNYCATVFFCFYSSIKKVFHEKEKKHKVSTQDEKEPWQIDVSNVNNGSKRITKY